MDERRTGGESLDGTRGVVVPDTGGVSTGAEIHLPQPHMRSTAMTATLASPRRLISALLAAALAATIGSVRPAVASPASPKAGPTNGRIVFVSGRTGNADIWSVNPDGTGLVNLTNDMGDDSEPAVSADGTRIAWISDRDQGNRDVYVMNADGTDVQRLTTDPEMESWPSFSPDGTRIVFGSNLDIFNDTDPQIYVMGVDRSNLTRLTTDGSWDDQARFSPDGSKIVFTSRRDGDPEIWVMNADGSGQHDISHNEAFDQFPSWSPDGQLIAFQTNRDEDPEIYTMNPNGSNQTDATNDHAFRDEYPWWSPDGSQLVFTSNRSAAAGPVAPADSPLPDDRVWVMPFPGGPADSRPHPGPAAERRPGGHGHEAPPGIPRRQRREPRRGERHDPGHASSPAGVRVGPAVHGGGPGGHVPAGDDHARGFGHREVPGPRPAVPPEPVGEDGERPGDRVEHGNRRPPRRQQPGPAGRRGSRLNARAPRGQSFHTRRRSVAQRVSSYRLDSWSLRSTADTWVSTVFTEMWSCRAICLYA